MTRNSRFSHALLALILAAAATVRSQGTGLTLTAKLRDFKERNSTDNTNTHPDFNDRICNGRGAVDTTISTAGALGDTGVFNLDNREPRLVSTSGATGQRCYEDATHFSDWYNDKIVAAPTVHMNRPFLMQLNFQRDAGDSNLYVYDDQEFFPMDNKPAGVWQNLPGSTLQPFGHLTAPTNNHNYGFTMEFHARFTYVAGTNQTFTFRGDDDVWVFVNGKLAIDLGGVHEPQTASFNLDNIAARHGLANGGEYILDFFFAERHVVQSSVRITTTILLNKPSKVATPIPNPLPQSFTSTLSVSLSTSTPGSDVDIRYTVNGADPDSTSPKYVPGSFIRLTSDATIRAIAYKPGWIKSDILTAHYDKLSIPSTLDILDANGNPLAGGYLTERNQSYMVRVSTTQADLGAIHPVATTKNAGDREILSISNPAPAGDRLVYDGTVVLSISAAAANGRTDANAYDTLTVTWKNPLDSVNDVATKKVPIRPFPIQSSAYFSKSPTGADTTDQFAGNETVIYLIVRDQELPPGATPVAVLTTRPLVGGAAAADTGTFNLVKIAGKPGYLVATIPVATAGAPTPGNGTLRLSLQDQITGTYQDPVDPDNPAVANAGFGVAPNIDGNVQFTDAAYNVFPGVTPYDPSAGRLYLRYVDDWAAGSIASKKVTLTIENNNGGSAADAETLYVALDSARRVGSQGVWVGSIALKDLRIKQYNDTAEFYIVGKVTASVVSHAPDKSPAGVVTDQILVAFPDVSSKIGLQDSRDTGIAISRVTDGLIVKLNDQSLSTAVDTLYVTLKCSGTLDVVTVRVIETGATTGEYRSVVVTKNEGTPANDGTLTCRDRDIINAKFVDPVYPTGAEINVAWNNPLTPSITYVRAPDGTDPITTVFENDAASFKVVVVGTGKSLTVRDTVVVTFTTAQNEKETVLAVETGVHTQIFEAIVPIAFVTGGVTSNNGVVEGRITTTELDNRVTVRGTVTINGEEAQRSIVLVAAFLPVVKAWITDVNGDGRGDRVFVQFEKPATRSPDTLWAQWNGEAEAAFPFKAAPRARLSFNADSTVLIADYSASPFGVDLTSIAPGQSPKARLPADPLFAGQLRPIEDSIGPVIVSILKTPADETNLKPDQPGFNLDTLRVKVSEPLQTPPLDMIRFSSKCGEYGNSTVVTANSIPTQDPKDPSVWIVVVNISNTPVPLVGNCVYLNADPGKVEDMAGNTASKLGKQLTGKDRPRVIQLFRGFPPVAGMDPSGSSNSLYQVAVQDSRDSLTGYVQNGVLEWVPPVGFVPGQDYKDEYANRLKPGSNPTGEIDATRRQPFPRDISAIQVVATSKYIAHVTIFDNLGHMLTSFTQTFGFRGEMDNDDRAVRKGRVSYLVWNQKDKKGQIAGQGVFVWKVVFTFETGKQEIQYTRTGITRRKKD